MKEEKVSQYCSTNVVRILFSRIIFHQHENTSKWIQYCVPITDCTLPWSDLESWELEPCQIESEKCKWHPCSRGRGRAAFDILKVSMKFCGNFQNIKNRICVCMQRHSLMLGLKDLCQVLRTNHLYCVCDNFVDTFNSWYSLLSSLSAWGSEWRTQFSEFD